MQGIWERTENNADIVSTNSSVIEISHVKLCRSNSALCTFFCVFALLLMVVSAANAVILPYPLCDAFDDPSSSLCLDITDPPECTDCSCATESTDDDCPSCGGGTDLRGMPVWWVSQPYINLRLEDEPLGYQPARGKRVSFHLSYRQRGNPAQNSAIFGLGPNWSTAFKAYVIDFTTFQSDSRNVVRLHCGGAGWVEYINGMQARDRSVVTALPDGGYKIEYANGARDLFQKPFDVQNFEDTFTCYFITASIDAEGVTNTFRYATNASAVLLQNIVDAEGNATTLYYENANFPSQVTRVQDPFGRSCSLTYDVTGYLTNVVDVAGMGTSFGYDASNTNGSGWLTNMTTPYGTTSFRYGGQNMAESGLYSTNGSAVNRLIDITEANDSHQLYVYRNNSTVMNDTNSTPFLPTSYSDVPSTAPLSNMFDNAAQSSRNSFHWNRMQYSGLSADYRLSGAWRSLTLDDYKIARLRHWLADGHGFVSGVLSLERAPSQDGVIEGQRTWYDYQGKSSNSSIGTNASPLYVARVLPDGTTWFKRTVRNNRAKVTTQVDTYSALNGTVGLRTNTLVYDANGIDLIAQYGPSGQQVVSNIYNGFHQPTEVYNALNERTLYKYNSSTHLVTNIIRPSGLTNIYIYDDVTCRLKQTIDEPIHRTNSYTYYSNGLVRTHTDPRGLTLTNSWDDLQRLVSVYYPDGTTVSNIYTCLDLTATKNRLGHWTQYAYNAVRQKAFQTNANSTVTAYGYCDCGALMYLTNALGTSVQEITSFVYDYQGNRTYASLPDGTTITNWYDALGRNIITADGAGSRFFYYNNQGQLTNISNASGIERRITYDFEDQPIYVTDANGVTVTNTYDPLSRIVTRSYPCNASESFGYTFNVYGPTSYTNQLKSVTLYGYDSDGRKTNEVKVGVSTNSLTYSAAGDVRSLTDGKNQAVTWHYDLCGHVTNELDSASTEILRFKYDANGQLTNRWSLAKGDTGYSYDPVGNLTTTRFPNSTIVFTPDPLNRLSTMSDASGLTTYTYTPGGRVQSEDGPWDNDTVTYTYTNRLRATMTINSQPQSLNISYGYDAARRLTNVTSLAGSFGYHYAQNTSSPLARAITLPNGAAITNTYDSLARLQSTALLNAQQTILNSHSYVFNPASQRTNQTRVFAMGGHSSTWTSATNAVAYAYDSIGQLTSAQGSEAGGATGRLLERFGYAYDPAGNLSWRTNNGLLQAFNVNRFNQLTNVGRSGTLTVRERPPAWPPT